MYMSENKKADLKKAQRIYLVVSVFCVVFSMVYESFSHNVYSPYMVFAVAFPLIGGMTVTEWVRALPDCMQPNKEIAQIYNLGLVTLMVGSIVKGILDIYGTEHPLIKYYMYVGVLFLIAAIVLWMFVVTKRKPME